MSSCADCDADAGIFEGIFTVTDGKFYEFYSSSCIGVDLRSPSASS